MTCDELKQTLQRPYERAGWLALLRELFDDVEILSAPHTISGSQAETIMLIQLGRIRLHDGSVLMLL